MSTLSALLHYVCSFHTAVPCLLFPHYCAISPFSALLRFLYCDMSTLSTLLLYVYLFHAPVLCLLFHATVPCLPLLNLYALSPFSMLLRHVYSCHNAALYQLFLRCWDMSTLSTLLPLCLLFPKLVQDCVFTWSLEFWFGVRRKVQAEAWLGVRVQSSEKRSGLILVQQVQSLEKGMGRTLVCQVLSSEKGMGRNLVRQVRSSEKRQG